MLQALVQTFHQLLFYGMRRRTIENRLPATSDDIGAFSIEEIRIEIMQRAKRRVFLTFGSPSLSCSNTIALILTAGVDAHCSGFSSNV